ncbi:acyl-CoA dehydrogenase family protein [Paenibacillus alkaliterrae]|uniref:acyl-CoA dehydrogenase family protein n=1 Tax=Paenibacillus alkaliterrae TaxID=320909 RepID=UPI001F3DF6F3|nr:acyl-CoA dehydrogenase family protein [Paenibacillus alkaliterrae]MCF2940149.1 acyl-CoA dehydrogenase family protein [Paenibacillus alkaliterrae]
MRFQLTGELEMTRSVVREFAENEVALQAGQRDEEEQFDRKLFAKIGELGLAGIPIPEQDGGAGSDFLTYAVVLEELSRVCASIAAVVASHTAYCAWPLFKFGHPQLKLGALAALAGGRKLGAFGSLDARIDNAVGAARMTSRVKGNDFVLNGSQPFVMNAGAADYYMIFAHSAGERRTSGFSAFLVESGLPGLKIGEKAMKLGLRSMLTAEIIFEECEVPYSCRVGKAGQGQEIAKAMYDIGQIGAAAQAVGIAQGALEAATGYAKERKQFSKPIGRQQGISFKLADMSAKIEAARLLAYQASWRMNEGLICGKEAAMARKYAADTAVSVTIDAVQVFGGYGYMREYRMERYLRDAKCLETDIGTGGMNTDIIFRILAE